VKFTEQQLLDFASPISKSEEEKCKNAIRMVRDAMKLIGYTDNGNEIRSFVDNTYSFRLDMTANDFDRKIVLLVQGSYANKTNIPSQSDVDVAVILESSFRSDYRRGVTGEDYDFSPAKFSAMELKNDVEKALTKKFSRQGVERHNKCLKVFGNTYRVDADVVPAIRYRDYSSDFNFDSSNYVGGILICPDKGEDIINYPEQHIKCGNKKNHNTQYNFKKYVRIVKNIREQIENTGISISPVVSSFGLESLLWNVDDSTYTEYPTTLRFIFADVINL
jgi:hypothetical protein